MFASHLECPKCSLHFETEQPHQLCSCGSPLLVRYDLEKVAANMSKDVVSSRAPDLWRYRELLPVKDEQNIVTMGEGLTPLLKLERLGKKAGFENLYMKDEGIIPTGSFKARGAAVGVSRAKELGVKTLGMPTNGNAGGAWALYCAKAGIEAVVVMPKDAPVIPRSECSIAGASLSLVNGLISDAGKIVGQAIREHEWYDASTLKEPYRIEGKKTMGLELAEQFGWEMPDVVLYPTGGGVGLIGIYKALLELKEIGWVHGKLPRLVAVQATGCAPIVRAWEAGEKESEFWENASTCAFGITVPKAIGDFLVLEAVYETDGCAIAISDEDTLEAEGLMASTEGAFVCPEGAACMAAAQKLLASGWLKSEERVVVLNTGCGIKYPETVHSAPPVLQPGDALKLFPSS